MTDEIRNLGRRVTLAGTGINLLLGVLYTWSVISKEIPADWNWTEAQCALPYSVACLMFAFVMVPAGRLQDRIGPRWVAFAGGIAVGLGLILASRATSVAGYIVGFGLLGGAGIGLGYASATPPAIKWFPPRRTGLIAGIVVAGFGLASVYISPLAKTLIGSFGIPTTMMVFGIVFFAGVSILSMLLVNPPAGFKPEDPDGAAAGPEKAPPHAPAKAADCTPVRMLRTPQFYLMWFMFAFAAGAGLMIISKLSKIVNVQAGIKAGFWFVALLAIGNAAGRIIAGTLSDRIGRTVTMIIVFLFQAVLMFTLHAVDTPSLAVLFSIFLGFNYGANLSIFPSAVKDYFGLKNFGVNYGLVFTAWGAGGFVFPLLSGKVYDRTLRAAREAAAAAGVDPGGAHGNFGPAYTVAGVLLLVAAVLAFALKSPAHKRAPV